jgi:hypothetical protein
MDSYLGVVSPFLASSLVDRNAWSRLREVARLLPPCSLAGLELRLRDDQPTVDFFVRLPYASPRFSALLLAHPVWQSVARLCGEVADPSNRLHERVARIFVEFDLGAPPPAIPVPGLFLQLHTGRAFSAVDVLAVVEPVVVHCEAPLVSKEALDRCLRALPAGATVAHVGVMLSRPGAALRLVFHGVHSAGIADYLESIGWQDSTGRFSSLVADLSPHADRVAMLDIDIADTLRPKVGVEFYLRQEIENRSRWEALLALLATRGLASHAKAAAILDWPGWTQERAGDHQWPENLAPGDLLLRGTATSVFWRNINHVKLGYQPGQEAEVKIYLGFGHNWISTAPALRQE